MTHPGYGASIPQYPAYHQQQFTQYPYAQNAYPNHASYPGHVPHAAGYAPTHYNPSYPNPGTPAVPSVSVAPTPAPPAPVAHVEQWCPSHADNDQIDKWFKELDKESCSIIRGLEVARFLQRSNLSRDTLRTIWAVVDSDNKGYINRVQFNTVIRLVSISCYPVYMGAPPTMERYYATLRSAIPLPASLFIAPPPDPNAQLVVAASAPATAAVPATHANVAHPPPVIPFGTVAEQEEEEEEFSDFTAAVAPVAPLPASAPSLPIETSVLGRLSMEGTFDTSTGSGKAPVSPAVSASLDVLDDSAVKDSAATVVAPSIAPTGTQTAPSSGYGDDFLVMNMIPVAVVIPEPALSSAAVKTEERVEEEEEEEEDDDSMGDFTSATASAATTATTTSALALKKQTSADMIASAFGPLFIRSNLSSM